MRHHLVLHQSLHGYDRGHRWLAGSMDLPHDAERVVLALSDLSGSMPGERELSYVTGYPVPGTDYYAIARTWTADELSRPGCVWTHTLYLDPPAVATLADARSLNRLWRRPTAGAFPYTEPIRLMDASGISEIQVDLAAAGALLKALCADGEPSVAIAVEPSQPFDNALLGIWSQCWPQIRKEMTFCSRSASPRSLLGQPFMLQGVPRAARSRWQKRTLDRDDPATSDLWIQTALRDMCSLGSTPLRSFLSEYGQSSPVRSLQAFVTLFTLEADWGPYTRILSVLKKEFSSVKEARALKGRLLGANVSRPIRAELELLQLLAEDTDRSLPIGTFDLSARSRTIARREPRAAWSLGLAAAHSKGAAGHRILEGLAAGASATQLRSAPDSLVGALVGLRPSLAADPGLWKEHSESILSVLLTSTIDQPNQLAIAGAIVSALHQPPRSLLTAPLWVDALAVAYSTSSSTPLPPGAQWSDVVINGADALVEWVKSHPTETKPLETMAATLDPLDPVLSTLPGHHWLRIFPKAEKWREPCDSRIAAFLFVLGCRVGDGEPLVAASFGPLYGALARQALQQDAWEVLDRHLPTVPFWADWDRCARLEKGVKKAAKAHHWAS